MKLLQQHKNGRALTLIEVLVIIAAITIVATLVLPPGHHRVRAKRIVCVNNLRQMGIAFRIWSNEHSELLPWNVPQTNGGTMELAMSADVSRHFEIASNEMNSPKILYCPSDTQRSKTNAWQPRISNQNISYFVGLDAAETKPQSILSGDRNLSTNNNILVGVVTFPNPTAVHWTSAIHKGEGNFGLGDGSVMQVSARNLFQSVTNAGVPLRLSIP